MGKEGLGTSWVLRSRLDVGSKTRGRMTGHKCWGTASGKQHPAAFRMHSPSRHTPVIRKLGAGGADSIGLGA